MRRLQLKQTLLLIVMTVVYLTFELGFNARLLDVVGAVTDGDTIESIEMYGRTLSGIAVALVVFQLMLNRRTKNGTGKPSKIKIGLCCLITIFMVYGAIKALVDDLVASCGAEFRSVAVNTVLLQGALISGRVTLDGLSDDKTIFSKPEGKAFVALFPLMATSVDHLEERIKDEKEKLISDNVRKKIGYVKGYFELYQQVIKETHTQWLQYARIPAATDEGLLKQQNKAWHDYVRKLAGHNWTPNTVPPRRQPAVVRQVRKTVPVPSDWQPNDEATFRAAVEKKYRRSMAASARSINVEGDIIPPGLSFPAFIARKGVQKGLKQKLMLSESAVVASDYTSTAEFEQLYNQMVRFKTQQTMREYDGHKENYEPGNIYFQNGTDAARAVIVPPVALFFSLLGAIGHLSKLMYLIAKAVLLVFSRSDTGLSRRSAWIATGVLVCAFAGGWGVLAGMQNAITQSDLFRQMITWMKSGPNNETGFTQTAIAEVVHVVAVGQGYTYNFNEHIRENILMGLSYGYHDKK